MEYKRKRRKLKRWQKILIGILIFLVTFVLLVLAAFAIIRYLGKGQIMDANAQGIPILESEETGEDWQEGWVRHNGRIYAYNEDIMTFLIMGIDKEGEVETGEDGIDGGQSDAMFLAVMNPHTNTISIIAINRNTMAMVDVYDTDGVYMGEYTKQICLQHGYGDGRAQSCERAVAAVSRLFYQLPINGYVSINMDAIPELNDVVGGVEVTVLDDVVYPEYDMDLHAGDVVVLNGHQAYWYVRGRYEYVFNSTSLRLERQKQYLTTFIAKAKQQALSNFSTALNLYDTISRYMVTDIDFTKFTYLASEALSYDFNIEHLYTMEGETLLDEDNHEEFYVDNDALYEMVLEVFYEPVEENAELEK